MSRLLQAVRRRFVGARRSGSVLLIVIGLLELLALVGAAWVITARADRHGSAFNVANTQIDLLVDGLRNMTAGTITESPLAQVSVDPYSNNWIASRVPDVSDPTKPLWPYISAPLMSGTEFASPLSSDGTIVSTAVRTRARPGSVNILGRQVPTLTFDDGKVLLAVDTDRDGVADAALWPLPVGQINGITYYAAVRIIDNNSAVNASIAWDRGTAADVPGNVFPVNVSLMPMLVGGSSEMSTLNAYRAGGSIGLTPIDDSGYVRTDFSFITPYDALWQQLGRRLGNPGYNTPGLKYRALSPADAIALGYGFVRRNGNNSPTVLESALTSSLLNNVPTVPYAVTQTAQWAANFNYATNTWSRRALLAVSNPITMQVAGIRPPTIFTPGNVPANFAYMRAADAIPVRTSINTAKFDELWRTFWSLMATQVDANGGNYSTPFGDAGATTYTIYDPAHPQRMFRSSLRDPRYAGATFDSKVVRFSPQQQLALRAALAALNTIDLRDADREATGARLALTARIDDADVPVDVMAFGGEPQPFITEVYAQTDTTTVPAGASGPNLNGYVAIELFNPYPWPITIDSTYRLVTLDRRPPSATPAPTSPYPNMKLKALQALTAGKVIPPGGYLILENCKGDNTGTAKYRPTSSGLPLVGALPSDPTRDVLYVADLDQALDRELILLKQCTNPSSIALQDMIPIDQFDFTGMPAAGAPPFNVLHYARCNDSDTNRWKPMYPGRYDGSKLKQRHEGTQQDQFDGATPEPPLTVTARLGASDPTGSYTNPFIPIQWCSVDSAGPYGVAQATGNRFPFGGFARIGDILQVPFIGRYTVRLRSDPTTIIEMNSVPMDVAFADDGDPSDDGIENVGRFCPTFGATGMPGYTVPPTGSGYDPSQALPIVHTKFWRKFYPGTSAANCVIRNETRGELHATWTNAEKGFQVWFYDGFKGPVDFINCLARDITRDPGVHTDGFWCAAGPTNTDLEVRWTDCVVSNIAGPSVLWENGSAKRLMFRNTNVAWKYEIKLMPGCVVDELVFDNTYGNLSFTFMGGKCNKIYLNNFHGGRMNCPGAQVIYGLPPDLMGNGATTQPNSSPGTDFYAWSSDLFQKFTTIGNVHDDYLPNHVQSVTGMAAPMPVANDVSYIGAANGGRENAVGLEGLVNINSAPWKVIAALPMLPTAAANDALAQAIVAYRDQNGPFLNFYDLYKVPAFKAAQDAITAGPEPDDADGDFSPIGQGITDHVRDFEERFLLLNRISNMITLRSDSFTCYMVLQGWKGAGTPAPELVVERRLGMIIDRSSLSPTNKTPKIINFPMD